MFYDIKYKSSRNGNKCLEYLFSNTDDNYYDIIILNTRICDILYFDIARNIHNILPHNKIILTTINSLDNIRNIIDSNEIIKLIVIIQH